MKRLNATHAKLRRRGTEGSALLTALIFSFVVMTLMGSYLYLSSSENRLASRSYLYNSSFNLAEGGIELALNALNENDQTDWSTGSDGDGDVYWARAYPGYDLGGGLFGEIRVVILKADTKAPEVYSEGLVEGAVVRAMTKQLRVQLSSGFFPFMNGFNSKKGVYLKGGNVTFDSYDTRKGSYGLGNIHSEITVASISFDVDAVDIGNADIYGYVATGGGAPYVGPSGSITDYSNMGQVDQSRITTDYYASFPNVSVPALSGPKATLPDSGTVSGGEYLLSSWEMTGSKVLDITGDTTIVVTGDMKMSGSALVRVGAGATVKIYIKGDADLSGNGILNASQKPEQLLIFGTNPSEGGQTIKVSGNGYLAAAVYAPNAVVELKGGGSSGRIFGAVAGYDAKLTGNTHYSYDEALADYNMGGAGYAVEEWVELVGARRAPLQIKMSDYGL